MADQVLVFDVDDVEKLVASLAGAGKLLAREQRRANKQVAEQVTRWAVAAAGAGTAQQKRAASAIRPRSTQAVARLAVAPNGRVPYANAAFWGMSRRTGWYGRERYAASAGRQAPPWVGASWTPGVRGEGPYVLNDTIADHVDDIGLLYLGAHERAVTAAFGGR